MRLPGTVPASAPQGISRRSEDVSPPRDCPRFPQFLATTEDSPKLSRKQLTRQLRTYTGQQPSGLRPQRTGKQRPERPAPLNPEQRSGLSTTFLSPLLAGFLRRQPTEFIGRFLSKLPGQPPPELPRKPSREQLGELPPGWGSELATSGITSQATNRWNRKPPIRFVALSVYKMETRAPPVRNSLPALSPCSAYSRKDRESSRPPHWPIPSSAPLP